MINAPLQLHSKPSPTQDILLSKKILSPEKLKILILSGNEIISQELKFLPKCVNLLKLDLSHNHITEISTDLELSNLQFLQILYLHSNNLKEISNLSGLVQIPNLLHLTYNDNPLETITAVEHILVCMFKKIRVLGNRIVGVGERAQGLWTGWDCEVRIDKEVIEGFGIKDTNESSFIYILKLQLKYYETLWLANNPIVKIQRFYRKHLEEQKIAQSNIRKLSRITNQATYKSKEEQEFIHNYFQEWKSYVTTLKYIKKSLKNTQSIPNDKSYLSYQLEDYRLASRNLRIGRIFKKFIEHIKNKIYLRRQAEKIVRQLARMKDEFQKETSFLSLCIHPHKHFYFNQNQLHLLNNFLEHISTNFNYHDQILKETKITKATKYLTIRTVEPESYARKKVYSALTYLMYPSAKAILLKTKKYPPKNMATLINIKPLYYIKNQNKVLTKEEYKKSCNVYQQLLKFSMREYENSLTCFECSNNEIMQMLIRYIYYHNTKTFTFKPKKESSALENYTHPFVIYAESLLERTSAAVRIQQKWRKYLVVKYSKEPIYSKMKKTRAVLRIQSFWRNHIFYHRLQFHKNIHNQLKLFKSSSFYIPCSAYLQMQEICKTGYNHELYPGLTLEKSKENLLKIYWEMDKQIIPKYLENVFPERNNEFNYEECNIWNILHLNSNVSKIKLREALFYEFKFSNLAQTKFRIYLLALFTYNCRGSLYFLPLSKDTLNLFEESMMSYKKLGIVENFANSSAKQEKEEKITLIKKYNLEGICLDKENNQQETLNNQHKINLEFYQKVFQDFPKKYLATLIYYQKESKEISKADKEILKMDKEKEYQSEIQTNKSIPFESQPKNTIKEENEFNVSKISKNKLILFDIGGKTAPVLTSKDKTISREVFMQTEMLNLMNRKNKIEEIKKEENAKKEEIVQKRKLSLKKIRDEAEKEKNLNQTFADIKEFDRFQEAKKKVERIKEMKNRASLSRKKESGEDDFVQQGNFVMKQEIKMMILRTKSKNKKEKEEEKERVRAYSLSRSKYSSKSSEKSLHSERNEKSKVSEKIVDKTIEIPPLIKNESEEHLEKKISNARNHKKNRLRNVGAYIRDPSLVHGVFPEEYYPIESSSGTFGFLPKLP